jgi:hypothetical protein
VSATITIANPIRLAVRSKGARRRNHGSVKGKGKRLISKA